MYMVTSEVLCVFIRWVSGQKSWLRATDGDSSSLRQKEHALEGFFVAHRMPATAGKPSWPEPVEVGQ